MYNLIFSVILILSSIHFLIISSIEEKKCKSSVKSTVYAVLGSLYLTSGLLYAFTSLTLSLMIVRVFPPIIAPDLLMILSLGLFLSVYLTDTYSYTDDINITRKQKILDKIVTLLLTLLFFIMAFIQYLPETIQ